MSFYNLYHNVNPTTFIILPMLGKHPDDYPRFRDSFIYKHEFIISEDGFPKMTVTNPDEIPSKIYILLRVGRGNRETYQNEIQELRSIKEYIEDFDDNFDNTYAMFVFNIPDKFKSDFDKICEGKLKETSQEYKDILYKVYPKLSEKWDKILK